MKSALSIAVIAMLVLSGCGGNSGRCNLTTPSYPLCGI